MENENGINKYDRHLATPRAWINMFIEIYKDEHSGKKTDLEKISKLVNYKDLSDDEAEGIDLIIENLRVQKGLDTGNKLRAFARNKLKHIVNYFG